MKKKWIWLLLPAALLLLILLHVHSLARLAPSEIGRQVPVLMYHAAGGAGTAAAVSVREWI